MVQDAPEFLGVELGPDLVLEVARANPPSPASSSRRVAERIAEWVAQSGDLGVFGGNAGLFMLDTLDAGGVGIAPGADITDALTAIYALWRAGGDGGSATPLRRSAAAARVRVAGHRALQRLRQASARAQGRRREQPHARSDERAERPRTCARRARVRRDSRGRPVAVTSRRSSPAGTRAGPSGAPRPADARGNRSRSPCRPAGCARRRASRSHGGRPVAGADARRGVP